MDVQKNDADELARVEQERVKIPQEPTGTGSRIQDASQLPSASDESGDIGDEQCPAGIERTDKQEWNGAADKRKKESILPKRIREFMNGL